MNAKPASERRIQDYHRLTRRQRICVALICVAVVVVGACSNSRRHEPIYEGKQLSAWTDELNKPWQEDEPRVEVTARQEMWTNVVKSVGVEGLPLYLNWMGDTDHPQRKNASVMAFEILGPSAEAAIPKLANLMKDDKTAYEAADCLRAIGPASIPALINIIETTTNRGRYSAISVLGQFGKVAQSSAPALIQIIRTDPISAMEALRALVEVETNTDIVMPVLVEHVAETNNAFGAAYSLGRLGRIGIPILLQSLTNEPRTICAAVEAALDPTFQLYSLDNQNAPDSGFLLIGCIYNLAVLNAASRRYSQGDFRVAAETAAKYTNDPSEIIRTAASNSLYYLTPFAETNVSQRQLQELNDFRK